MAFLIHTLLGPLIGALVTGAFSFLTGMVNSAKDQQLGAVTASNAVAQQSVKTEAAIANAEASAPKTQAGVVSSLESGSF